MSFPDRDFDPVRVAEKALWVRRVVLEMAVAARSGHVTTAFSQTEILCTLYYGGLLHYRPDEPRWLDRDRFILSKGQGGIGLYPILADVGFFPLSDLANFAGPGSNLGVHAEWHVPGIEVVSGSLGHGLPLATGMALAARWSSQDHLVVCLTGDGELYEGSCWEALAVANHLELDNLVVIVDRNGQATLGYSDEIESPLDGPRHLDLEEKLEAFGLEVRACDGHVPERIATLLEDARRRVGRTGRPLAVVAKTEKGHGSAFLAGRRGWHYRVPSGEDLAAVRGDLGILTPGVGQFLDGVDDG